MRRLWLLLLGLLWGALELQAGDLIPVRRQVIGSGDFLDTRGLSGPDLAEPIYTMGRERIGILHVPRFMPSSNEQIAVFRMTLGVFGRADFDPQLVASRLVNAGWNPNDPRILAFSTCTAGSVWHHSAVMGLLQKVEDCSRPAGIEAYAPSYKVLLNEGIRREGFRYSGNWIELHVRPPEARPSATEIGPRFMIADGSEGARLGSLRARLKNRGGNASMSLLLLGGANQLTAIGSPTQATLVPPWIEGPAGFAVEGFTNTAAVLRMQPDMSKLQASGRGLISSPLSMGGQALGGAADDYVTDALGNDLRADLVGISTNFAGVYGGELLAGWVVAGQWAPTVAADGLLIAAPAVVANHMIVEQEKALGKREAILSNLPFVEGQQRWDQAAEITEYERMAYFNDHWYGPGGYYEAVGNYWYEAAPWLFSW